MNENDLTRMNKVLRHRIRNVASGIKSTITFLQQDLQEHLEPQQLEYFPLMLAECDALVDITNRLTLFFDALPAATPMSVGELVDAAVAESRKKFPTTAIDAGGVESQRALAVPGGPAVLAILRELLSNGAEAAPGKPLAISLVVKDKMARFGFADAGPALAADVRVDDFFLPFFTTRPRHLGLGLPIAQRVANHLGGRVCASRAATGGVLCELFLPLIK